MLSSTTLSAGRFPGHDPHVSRVLRMGRPGQALGPVSLRWCRGGPQGHRLVARRARESARAPLGSTAGATWGCRRRARLGRPASGCRIVGVLIDWGIASADRARPLRRAAAVLAAAGHGGQDFVVLGVFALDAPAARRHDRLHHRPPDHGPAGRARSTGGGRRLAAPGAGAHRCCSACSCRPWSGTATAAGSRQGAGHRHRPRR